MRALRWHGREDVRLEDVPEPTAAGEETALVEVLSCGICGTDVAEFRDGPGMIRMTPHPLSGQAPPITLGHEFIGRVLVGESPDGAIAPGRRVTADACLRCQRCRACLRGDYHMCRYSGSIGLHQDGAFAPLVAVPMYTLVTVPDEVTDDQAALTEPFAVALHGLERADTKPGDDVLIFGFGSIGAAAALVARAMGARPHVVEIDSARRERAEQLGVATLEATDDLPRLARRQLGDGGADVVIESTGVAEVIPRAIECAARGGRIVLLGLPKTLSHIDPRRLTLFERSLVGSLGYRHDLPRVLDMVRDGRLEPAAIISCSIPLDEASPMLQLLSEGRHGGTIKVLVNIHA
jgi:(R,R)-butanediol dehydrogenase / meso-butanediol dehydrogenase / diacetyl reductase